MNFRNFLWGVFLMGALGFNKVAIAETIILEKIVPFSIEVAWKKWTEVEKLKSWLTNDANIELKVGGLYELFWEPEHPEQNSTIGCKVLALEPLSEITFEWKGPIPFADIMNVTPLPTWVRVTFHEIGKNQTSIQLKHFGWQTSPRWDEAKKWQRNAWLQAFARL